MIEPSATAPLSANGGKPGVLAKPKPLLVAMSGGVDSSVAVWRLKEQGHAIVGAYMKNWINEDKVVGHCPWMEDIDDARAVCDKLQIEFRVVNLMEEYRRGVVDYLLAGYERGLTPNPDVMCNREIKFGVFRQWAKASGFEAVATGHYARRVEAKNENRRAETARDMALPGIPEPKSEIQLWEGSDRNKDQSYFLALLNQDQLRDARFPIGDLQKSDVRVLARRAGLPTAEKKDSQGICFIGEVKMQDFLRAYVPDAPGPIVRATDGRTLGEHRGLHFYTLGQRRGIRVPSNTDNEAYVVVGKRASDRALLVAFDGPQAPGLFQTEVRVHSLSWIGAPITSARPLEGRVRYRDPRVALQLFPEADGTARVTFREPQRGLASGQILAFYEGGQLLGGAVYL